MRRIDPFARALVCVAAMWLLVGCGTTAPRRDLTPKVQKHTLENGLDVYLLEDSSAPIFTFQYWVRVGSADEREGDPGITGLSHFFEHMMFRGTPRYPSYFEEISKRGGKLNAFTWLDVTVYWDKLASTDLEFVLDIESDRLRNMKIDFLNLEPEREVVKSERLLRTENSPSGSLREAMSATYFTKHPYHWPTVGWMRDLNAITVEQAQQYHRRFYAPDNAYVVLVGDFEAETALELVKRYYGDFERRGTDRPKREYDAPLTSERRTYVEKPTGTDLFMAMYPAPAGKDADFIVLEVIEELLTGGKTSRLQKALVHGDAPVARSVGSFAFPFVDPGVMMLDVQMLPGHAGRVGEERLTGELERLTRELVPADELKRAVAQLRADIVRGMTTTQSRAQLMGFSIRATGDPTLPWKRLQGYGNVTPADIQRVANELLQPSRRVVGHAVDPRKLVTLAESFLEAGHSGVAGLDAAVLDAVRHAAGVASARDEGKRLEMEKRAIDLLEQRANRERKRLSGNAEALKALDEYLNKGEKGVVSRRNKLSELTTALQQRLAAQKQERVELSDRLERLARDVEYAKKPVATQRLAWARALAQAKSGQTVADVSPGHELGSWALEALTRRHFLDAKTSSVWKVMKVRGITAETQAIADFAYAAQKIDAGRM